MDLAPYLVAQEDTMSNLKQIALNIKSSIPSIKVAMANSEVVGCKFVEGDITSRIFVKGLKTDGSDIGQYVNGPYKAKRNENGKRIDKVDLQYNGDLFNSIGTGKFNGKSAVGINNQKQNEIAGFNEERYGTIFVASDEEKRVSAESARDFLFKELKRIIGTWS